MRSRSKLAAAASSSSSSSSSSASISSAAAAAAGGASDKDTDEKISGILRLLALRSMTHSILTPSSRDQQQQQQHLGRGSRANALMLLAEVSTLLAR